MDGSYRHLRKFKLCKKKLWHWKNHISDKLYWGYRYIRELRWWNQNVVCLIFRQIKNQIYQIFKNFLASKKFGHLNLQMYWRGRGGPTYFSSEGGPETMWFRICTSHIAANSDVWISPYLKNFKLQFMGTIVFNLPESWLKIPISSDVFTRLSR